MTAPIESFRLSRDLPLPPDRMWHLLTDARAREAWGAPDGAALVMEVEDLREGGDERHRCGPADAPEFIVDTRWYHLDAPRRACFSETLSFGGAKVGVSLVTYVLETSGKGTSLVVDVAVASVSGEPVAEDFKHGWESGLDQLASLAASTEPAS